jgi:hypothetical protein
MQRDDPGFTLYPADGNLAIEAQPPLRERDELLSEDGPGAFQQIAGEMQPDFLLPLATEEAHAPLVHVHDLDRRGTAPHGFGVFQEEGSEICHTSLAMGLEELLHTRKILHEDGHGGMFEEGAIALLALAQGPIARGLSPAEVRFLQLPFDGWA